MDQNVPKDTKYYIDLILNFIKKYLKYFLLLLILILVIKKLYNVSPYNQISSTLIKVDKLYRNVFLQQKNFCSNTYKKYRLCDFYIASSYQSCINGLCQIWSPQVLKRTNPQ